MESGSEREGAGGLRHVWLHVAFQDQVVRQGAPDRALHRRSCGELIEAFLGWQKAGTMNSLQLIQRSKVVQCDLAESVNPACL